MARLRPFRGLRYTDAAGALGPLLSPPSATLTPNERAAYAARNGHNAVHLALPEGSVDDRSKFIRYARSAAGLAEARRAGILAAEPNPAFYRLTQSFGEELARTTLLAVALLGSDVRAVEATEPKAREDRLRLLEATRTAFEPSVAFYDDPEGAVLAAVRAAPASSEAAVGLDNVGSTLEAIDDPHAVDGLVRAFAGADLLVADGVDAYEASVAFRAGLGERAGAVPEDGAFLALASLDDPAYVRIAVHRVLRRLPGGLDAALAKLSTRFAIEQHHNRNLSRLIDGAQGPAFGMATEGGLGYLLTPTVPIDEPASVWLYREVFAGLLGVTDNDPTLGFTDPVQAVRAADEGAAAAFILPRPTRDDLRRGAILPHRAAATFPAIPTGLVFWSMGDDA